MTFINILSIFILHLHILQPLANESYFFPIPGKPLVGDLVIIKCQLTAPEGVKFKVITPELTTNHTLVPFSFDRIALELNDIRYNGNHIPDSDRSKLKGDITILYLRESDFNFLFTCLQEFENDTFFKLTLNLATQANSTQTNCPPSEVTCAPCEVTCPPCESTPVTCAPYESTPVTCPPYESTPVTCPPCECTTWKLLLASTSVSSIIEGIVIVGLVSLVIYCICKKSRDKQSYTSTQPTLAQFTKKPNQSGSDLRPDVSPPGINLLKQCRGKEELV